MAAKYPSNDQDIPSLKDDVSAINLLKNELLTNLI